MWMLDFKGNQAKLLYSKSKPLQSECLKVSVISNQTEPEIDSISHNHPFVKKLISFVWSVELSG